MMFKKAQLHEKKQTLAGLKARLAAINEMLRGSTKIPGSLVRDIRETSQRIAETEYDIAELEKPSNA